MTWLLCKSCRLNNRLLCIIGIVPYCFPKGHIVVRCEFHDNPYCIRIWGLENTYQMIKIRPCIFQQFCFQCWRENILHVANKLWQTQRIVIICIWNEHHGILIIKLKTPQNTSFCAFLFGSRNMAYYHFMKRKIEMVHLVFGRLPIISWANVYFCCDYKWLFRFLCPVWGWTIAMNEVPQRDCETT